MSDFLALLRYPLTLTFLLYQSVVLAITQLWSNKFRAMLTTVGIIIGVASTTVVIAALTGLEKNILSEVEQFGTNKVFINISFPSYGPKKDAYWNDLAFRISDFDQLLPDAPSIRCFTRNDSDQCDVNSGGKTLTGQQVQGIDPEWHEVENHRLIDGREFSYLDNLQARPVCILDTEMISRLNLPKDPIGQSITISSRRFLIVGVLEDKPQVSFGRNDTGTILVPFTTLMRMESTIYFSSVTALSRSPDLVEDAKAEITQYLRHVRGLAFDEPDTFRIRFVQDFIDRIKKISAAITLVATSVVGISLIVGGVGIMNIMLVSVSERTREIGLRKSVGARPSAILLQFLVEAIVLCFMGGLIGLAVGYGMTYLMVRFVPEYLSKAAVPPWAVLLSFGFSASIGLIFGFFPALKASRLDPIVALRHE